MKKGKNLIKAIGVGAFLKLSLLIPSSDRISETYHNTDSQQNLNKTEYKKNYGKEDDFPTRNYDYYSFTKSL